MRTVLVTLHRWFGLGAALFLFIAGATGAVISWDHEIDEWLNPQLFTARTAGPPKTVGELVAAVEAADPRARVSFHPLAIEPGHAFTASVQPRIDPATGRPFALGYSQVAVDPVTGQVQGQRQWGAISPSRENLLPFLYKLHYSMHLPEAGGVEWGIWLMGLIAIVWVFDTLVALWISFPKAGQWRRSFAVRWAAGGHKRVFDLHRSGGVWLFLLVLVLAVSSVAMNLNTQVMRPLVSVLSPLSPSPFASRASAPPGQPIEPLISRDQALQMANAQARRLGWTDPAGAIFLSTEVGVYGVGYFKPGLDHADGGLGNPWLYIDARTGAPAGADVPGSGSLGDLFMQSMFPLHSGRILGLPGRILVSLMGLAIAAFSVTGVMIWARKRRARLSAGRAGGSVAALAVRVGAPPVQ